MGYFLPPGFLINELEKAKIPSIPSENVEAPDPQQMIDLEVRDLHSSTERMWGGEER